MNNQNKIPNIKDHKILIGRNLDIQNIVSLLTHEKASCSGKKTHRLIQVKGPKGVGKFDITNYAI